MITHLPHLRSRTLTQPILELYFDCYLNFMHRQGSFCGCSLIWPCRNQSNLCFLLVSAGRRSGWLRVCWSRLFGFIPPQWANHCISFSERQADFSSCGCLEKIGVFPVFTVWSDWKSRRLEQYSVLRLKNLSYGLPGTSKTIYSEISRSLFLNNWFGKLWITLWFLWGFLS